MSTPFTHIGNGDTYDPTHIDIMNELIDAYNERRLVHGDSPPASNVVAGDDYQSPATIGGMQEWIQNDAFQWGGYNYGYWLDWTLSDSNDEYVGITTPSPNFPPQFVGVPTDLTDFYTKAGMNPSGFRRAIEWDPAVDDWTDIYDPMFFDFGSCEGGDIIGPWLYDDLQKAFSALRWTKTVNQYIDRYRRGEVQSAAYLLCTDALADANAQWDVASWQNNYSLYLYRVAARLRYTGTKWIFKNVLRQRAEGYYTMATDTIPCALDIYMFSQQTYMDYIAFDWADADSLGLLQDEWVRMLQLVEASQLQRDFIFPDPNIDTNPIASTGISCPTPDEIGIEVHRQSGIGVVKKWNFTNQGQS